MDNRKGKTNTTDRITRLFLAAALLQFVAVTIASIFFVDNAKAWLAEKVSALPITAMVIWIGSIIGQFAALMIIPAAGLVAFEVFSKKPMQKIILYAFVIIFIAMCEFILISAGFPPIYEAAG